MRRYCAVVERVCTSVVGVYNSAERGDRDNFNYKDGYGEETNDKDDG